MRLISFTHTEAQILARTKTVTRRKGWKNLKPGTLLQPVNKVQGFAKGEKPRKIGGPIRVVSVRRESLERVSQRECVLEGFPELTPGKFLRLFWIINRCDLYTPITRIEFEFVEEDQ